MSRVVVAVVVVRLLVAVVRVVSAQPQRSHLPLIRHTQLQLVLVAVLE